MKNDVSLSAVMEEFSKGYHRSAAVRDDSGQVINVITQSDIASFLLQNSQLMKDLLKEPIGPLLDKEKSWNKDVITVEEHESVISALRKMAANHVTGLPIVNKENKVVGNFSASDVRVLEKPSDFKLLSDHVKSFIEFTNQKHPKGTLSCVASDPVEDVLKIMSNERVHRVYLLDAQRRLQGVVSFTDIMRFFIDRACQTTHKQPHTAK